MSKLKNLRAIVREDCLAKLIQDLKDGNASRFYVTRVLAMGAGVDPEDYQVSVREGEAFSEKAMVEILCTAEQVEELTRIIRHSVRTGHRGDGVIIVSEVLDVVNVRTGNHDRVALL